MARWNNFAMLQGYVGTDPETSGSNGSTSVRFRMGVKRKYRGQDKTDWFTVWANGFQATKVQESVTKGSRVVVSGAICVNDRQMQDGTTKMNVDIWADDIAVVAVNTGSDEQAGPAAATAPAPAPQAAPAPPPAAAPAPAPAQTYGPPPSDGDMPF